MVIAVSVAAPMSSAWLSSIKEQNIRFVSRPKDEAAETKHSYTYKKEEQFTNEETSYTYHPW